MVDPFTVPLESKAELLFRINEEALKVKGVRFVTSSVTSLKESRLLATTDGSVIQQTFIRVSPNVNVTAVAADNSDSQTRGSAVAPGRQGLGVRDRPRRCRSAPIARPTRRSPSCRRRRWNPAPGTWCCIRRTCG